METITSKRHPLKFYGIHAFLLIISIVLSCILIAEGAIEEKKQTKLLVPLGILLFVSYSFFKYWRNTPLISIDQKRISFNSKSYSLEDIKKIEFTGKQPFPYLTKFPMEGAEILFKNGDIKYIYDDMYVNYDQLKVALDSKAQSIKVRSVDKTDVVKERFVYFKGNPLLNIRTLSLIPLITIFIFTLFQVIMLPGLLVLALFSGFVIYGITGQFCYFGVSKKYIIIKNHFLLWQTKIYETETIKEITFETQGNLPAILRLMTNNYKSKKYPACTLTDKNWLNLKKELERYDIVVKNECIIDKN